MKPLAELSPECANLVSTVGVGGGGSQALAGMIINSRYYKTRPLSRYGDLGSV